MATKVTEQVKNEFMEKVKTFLSEQGEEVLLVKSGTYSIPWAKGEDEGYINITFSIPKGSRDGTLFDGYEEAENYRLETEAKAEAKKEREEKKQKKIERDKKMRAEAAKKKAEREAKGEDK